MARRSRSRALVVGYGSLLVGLAVLALECRRAPTSTESARPVEERATGRGLCGGEEKHSDERDLPARAARRVDSSGAPCVITGMVYGSDGKPAAHADVTADVLGGGGSPGEDNDDEISATTDENGAFELELPPGDYALSADDDADEISEVIDPISLGAAERLDGIELHLGKGGSLSGKVVLAAGFGDDGPDEVDLCVLLHESDESCFASATVESDGRFTIESLPIRTLWLRASLDGSRTQLSVTPPASGLLVRLAPRPRISGIVRRDGSPISASVRVSETSGQTIHDGASGEDGQFSFETGARGQVTVWARDSESGSSATLTVDAEHAEDLTLDLRPGAALSGRVIRRDNGAPLEGSEVCLEDPLGSEIDTTATDDEGRYRFNALAPGRFVVQVCSLGGGSRGRVAGLPNVEVTVGAAETKARDLAVDRPRTIRGRVVGPDGKPVANADVDRLGPDGRLAGGLDSAETDERGEFELDTRVVGPVTLRAAAVGQVGDRRTVGESVGLDEEFVELHLFDECDLSGVVRGEGGLPRGGARVACGGIEHTSTGAGRFDLGCACDTRALTIDDGHGARLVPVHLNSENSVYVEVRL